MIATSVRLSLPAWVPGGLASAGTTFHTDEERMQLAILLARENTRHGTGGPFGAAILDDDSGRVVSVGVNLVVEQHCSAAHAEIVAIMLAQQALDTHDLGSTGAPALCLVSSTEPCAMCMGAVPWSGVKRLVCGARGTDAEAIGLDEGAKPETWVKELASRSITVTRDVCRDDARDVLQEYARQGGLIYNGRSDERSV